MNESGPWCKNEKPRIGAVSTAQKTPKVKLNGRSMEASVGGKFKGSACGQFSGPEPLGGETFLATQINGQSRMRITASCFRKIALGKTGHRLTKTAI